MEEVARYECVYHRNSRDFKDKNKKVNCWEKIGEKFNLSAAEAEVKFRNIRTAYGRYLKRFYLLDRGEMQCQRTQNRCFRRFWSWRWRRLRAKRRNKFACSKNSSSASAMLFGCDSRQHSLSAPVILALPLTEMQEKVGSAIVGDRLRLYGNNSLCDRLRSTICDPRSSAIVCDHMETSLKC